MGRTRRRTSENGSSAEVAASTSHSGDGPLPKRLKTAPDSTRRHLSAEEFRARATNVTANVVTKTARLLKTSKVHRHLVENRKAHHTNDFELDRLITRRGQLFKLTVEFEEAFGTTTDKVFLQFVTGAKPQQSKGTIIRIPVGLTVSSKSSSGPPYDWNCQTTETGKRSVTVTITPPSNSIVGRYTLFVETQSSGGDDEKQSKDRREEAEELYILFNPWCPEDTVFLADDVLKQEYVLNDRGSVWMGSVHRPYGRKWNFGQFDDPVLQAAIFLLNKSDLCPTGRSSPVSVIRAISALANSSDEDGGVLTGRWTSDYPPSCTVPWAWNGSVAILTQFMETGKAVEFGQCWVFSGLVTTLLRAIGIPTRSVTNYRSAHDTDGSMTIDSHWDKEGEPVEWRDDSIWNFHVWNESWLKRTDLPEGYDGWQAHDSTPQELSDGLMRCGPASLKAIKEGHVYLNYDVPFIFAEVNGDRVHWIVDSDGNMTVLDVEEHAVGHLISTKSVGSGDREDLTLQYKYPEGSEDERRIVHYVNRFSCRKKIYQISQKKDVTFSLNLPENPILGDDIQVTVLTKNNSSEQTHQVAVSISSMASFYTGIPSRRIKSLKVQQTIQPEEEKEIVLDVANEDYQGLMTCEAAVQIYAQCRVPAINQSAVKQASFFLSKPATLTVEMPERGKYKEDLTATIKFTNTLKIQLTNGVFRLEGAGLTKPQIIRLKKPVKPGEEVVHEVSLFAFRSGEKELMVDFSCSELTGVEGSATIYIPYTE
ncbi:protein-glutamine gamma-glutamyltransferase K-like [Liolophura sinensis]|uniref:protein-glutamine gamma-glutamyltransferase K-like n=1 Tax=Liolophura sinensis TaxID=3198878 RepID=UPI00315972F0